MPEDPDGAASGVTERALATGGLRRRIEDVGGRVLDLRAQVTEDPRLSTRLALASTEHHLQDLRAQLGFVGPTEQRTFD